MKRFLLMAVLFTGSLLMGQDTLILNSGKQHQVRFIEIRGNRAAIEIKGVGLGAETIVQKVPLNVVDKIILGDGTVVWSGKASELEKAMASQDSIQFSISLQEHQPESTDPSFTVRDLGVLLVAGSGVFGYINNNKECDPCDSLEDLEDFADDFKSRANLQYGSLVLGAILMLVGEDLNLVVPASE